MGPTAQDFRTAFGPGANDKYIAQLDANGVALAAIQDLNQNVEEQAAELRAKETELAARKSKVVRLKELRETVVQLQGAAIQGLKQKLQEELNRRDAENAELKREIHDLKQFVNSVTQKLNGGAK